MKTQFLLMPILSIFVGACSSNLPVKSSTAMQEIEVSPKNNPALIRAINTYTNAQTDFDVAIFDLNQDGLKDAVVLLKSSNWCGSGGCTMLIFKGKASQNFDFVSKTTLVDNPIYSTNYTQSGWKQLLVYSRKHGQVMLKFDGVKYPLNPSLLPLHVGKLAPDTIRLLFGENH